MEPGTAINNTKPVALKLRKLGIDSYTENIIYIRADSQVCISEGFKAETRLLVSRNGSSIIASLNMVNSPLLNTEEASLSEIAFQRLGAQDGDSVQVNHLEPIESLRSVRAKIYGNMLSEEAYYTIIHDITNGRYSDIQLSAFITACSGPGRMKLQEIVSLTKAMISTGEIMKWPSQIVVDKHCIGGLPGNRTTPIVVAIIAAAGLCIPKTSSRAITSPAGTADMMEVFTRVNISPEEMRKVVEKEGGCLAWGGDVKLSPADDILIQVERALDLDSEPQLIASVLSKKAAAGSNHVLLDIPVGATAKVRSWEIAQELKKKFEKVAAKIGIKVRCFLSDGSQPVGRGIGPVPEAIDVLSVLKNAADAPQDLRSRSLAIAAEILEMAGNADKGKAYAMAEDILTSGRAFQKFRAICEAQGRYSEPSPAPYFLTVCSETEGTITGINNRLLSMIAKLAGAPADKGAGLYCYKQLGQKITKGEPLLRIYSSSEGTLKYALQFFEKHPDIIQIQ
jgi:thymidine phosphorylase